MGNHQHAMRFDTDDKPDPVSFYARYRQLITDNFIMDETLQTYWKKCQNFLELPPADDKRKRLAWTIPALKITQDYWCEVEKNQQRRY
ncbi:MULTISPECIES: hypothetical protein [unclassified Moraxella]|uniref:hypothetical protein n=1 Tax=unclassified Moraxella TaxID=2685852 RepID=UPI00359DD596